MSFSADAPHVDTPRRYYVSFGVQYPREPHPRTSLAHRDGVIEIQAETEMEARLLAISVLGRHWSNIYDDSDVPWSYFPLGIIGHVVREGDLREGPWRG